MSAHPAARSRLLFGLLGSGVLAAGAVLVAAGATPSHAGSTHYEASFGRAGQGLDPGRSEVKVRGVAVGAVERVTLGRDGRVGVRLRVRRGVRVPDTATASIEPVSVFGPKDLALDLGAHETRGPYLRDGARIARTRDPRELSDTAWPAYRLTRAIDPGEVAAVLHVFGAGLAGRGPALRRTIRNGATVVDATWRDRQVLRALIGDLDGLSGTLADRGGTWTRFTGDFDRLADVVTARPDRVTRLLRTSGDLSDRIGATLQGHGRNLGAIVDGTADAAAAISGRRRDVPVLLDGLNGFFSLLSRIIRIPGPGGTLIGQARATVPLGLCEVIVDVCGAPPRTTAYGGPARRP